MLFLEREVRLVAGIWFKSQMCSVTTTKNNTTTGSVRWVGLYDLQQLAMELDSSNDCTGTCFVVHPCLYQKCSNNQALLTGTEEQWGTGFCASTNHIHWIRTRAGEQKEKDQQKSYSEEEKGVRVVPIHK